MAGSEIYRVEIPIIIDDQSETPLTKARERVNKFEQSAQKTNQRIQKMALTDYKLRLSVLDRAMPAIDKVGRSLKTMTTRAWTFTVGVKDRVTGFLGRIGRMLTSPLALLGIGGGVVGLGALIKDFTMTAGRTETLNIAMESVARSTGTVMEELLAAREAVMDLGIAEQEATLVMTRFMQGQLDIAQAAKIARVAQDAAVIAGTDSSEATETIVESISKLRPELLAQFGMTKNLNDVYAEYADQLGIVVKTTDKYGKTVRHMRRDLTEAEKKQAMVNYVLEEGAKIAGTYEGAMGSAFKKLGSLTRYWTDFKTKVGAPLFLAAFGSLIDGLTDAFKSGIEWAKRNEAVLERWGRSVAGVFDRSMERVRRIIESPEFKEAPFAEKVQMLIKAGLEDAVTWLKGPGGEKISEAIKSMGELLAYGIEEITPDLVPPAVNLGLEIGKGIIGGIYEAIKADPWAGMLIGGFIGFKLGGAAGILPGVTYAAAIWGLPKVFGEIDKIDHKLEELSEIPEIKEMLGSQQEMIRGLLPYNYPKESHTANNRPWADRWESLPGYAAGGIYSRPHVGMIGEAGPEVIIPLSTQMRARAMALWEETGLRLGVRPYAKGGFAGVPVATSAMAGAGTVNVKLSFDMAGLVSQVIIENWDDVDGAVDKVTGEMANKLRSVFQNMTE